MVSAPERFSRPALSWRAYRDASGRDPVGEFLRALPPRDRAALVARMEVARYTAARGSRRLADGLRALQVTRRGRTITVVFAREGRLLRAMDAFIAESRHVPRTHVRLARSRARDWRQRVPGRGSELGLRR